MNVGPTLSSQNNILLFLATSTDCGSLGSILVFLDLQSKKQEGENDSRLYQLKATVCQKIKCTKFSSYTECSRHCTVTE